MLRHGVGIQGQRFRVSFKVEGHKARVPGFGFVVGELTISGSFRIWAWVFEGAAWGPQEAVQDRVCCENRI